MVSSVYSQFVHKTDTVQPEKITGQSNGISTTIKETKDSVSISGVNGEPVGFKEGCSLVAQGFMSKIKNMVKTVIQHPVKTIGAMLLTSAALMALPFAGISMATGGAAIVTIYGVSAIYNTAKNLIKANRNSKKGNYNAMREDLKNVGGNCVDLALTLPFMPKAFKQLKLNVPAYFNKRIAIFKNENGTVISELKRYRGGNNLINYNSNGEIISQTKNSLWSRMLKAKTWKDRYKLLISQDRKEAYLTKLNDAYKQVAKDRGVPVPENLHYYNQPMEYTFKKGECFCDREGGFTGTTDIHINRNCVDLPQSFTLSDGKKIPVKTKPLHAVIGHEFRHVEQNTMIANAEGLKGKLKGVEWEICELYKPGTIKRGTPEHALAEKFYNAYKNYVQPEVNAQKYYNNALEVDARAVGETEIAGQIADKYKQMLGINKTTNKINPVKYNPAKDVLATDGIELSELSEVS